jgi:hypothetical protein
MDLVIFLIISLGFTISFKLKNLTKESNYITKYIMNITTTKILRELEKNYGWENMNIKNEQEWFVKELIKDTLKIVDKELRMHKNISINNKKNE